MVDDDEELSVRTQCRLLGVTRSMLYYEACPESAENLSLMRRLDELHLAHPVFGSRRLQTLMFAPSLVRSSKV